MTFTYASTDLSTTLAQVRLLIGDTNSADPQLTDEEIAVFTGIYGGRFFAAAAACDAIAGKYGRYASKTVGPVSVQYSDRGKQYQDLAARLRYQGATGGLDVYAGGISRSDKTTVADDSDRQRPNFLLGMDDKPGLGGPGRPSQGSSS